MAGGSLNGWGGARQKKGPGLRPGLRLSPLPGRYWLSVVISAAFGLPQPVTRS
jgi:hypothetical protein